MVLLIHIGVALVLALAVSFSSLFFGSVFKTDRVRKRFLQDQALLDRYVQAMNAQIPFSQQTAEMANPRGGHWMIDLGAWSRAETETKGLANTVTAAIALAVIVASFWFLGLIYGIVNVGLALTFFVGSSPSTEDVRKTVLFMAQIIYCWRRDDPDALRSFVQDAHGTAKLVSSIERLAT